MSKVFVAKTPNYDNIAPLVKSLIENSEVPFCKGDSVLVKPNLIAPRPASVAAQTDPAVILAVCQYLCDCGCKVTVGDSPAWNSAEECLKILGIYDELITLGVKIQTLSDGRRVKLANDTPNLSKYVLDAEKVINLPKFKSHQQMQLTVCYKNMFGAVVGKEKPVWHFLRGGVQENFADLILNIYDCTKPCLNLIDAVDSMHKQGPLSGEAITTGFLACSTDPQAIEKLCAKAVGLEYSQVPILRRAIERGDTGDFELIGATLEELYCKDFIHAEQSSVKFSFMRVAKSIWKNFLQNLAQKK